MPVYPDLEPFEYYPHPELHLRPLYDGIAVDSILDVGTGHGGVFDLEYWTKRSGINRRAGCDIFRCRPTEGPWELHDGVDVCHLAEKFGAKSFDVVQCMETLEHVTDSRKALEQLVAVARKLVVITSADETQHMGETQEKFERWNPACIYIEQPSVEDLIDLGFEVRVEAMGRRQLITWWKAKT